MSLPQGGFEQRREGSRRRRVFIWCAVLVVLVVGWAWVVLGWGGASGETASGTSEPEAEQTGDAGDGGDGAVGGRRNSGASSIPDAPAYAEGDGTGEGADTPAPDRGTLGDTGDSFAGESLGGQDGEGAQGATNEPGVYDPLGTGAFSSDLAPTDEARVRYAVEKFVMAAYGYTGSDGAEYLAGVAETSLSPDLSLSAGGSEISRYERQVEKSGTKSAAKLTRLESLETSQESVSANVYFQTGEGYGPNGELTGELLAYRQEMTLSRMGEVWRVKATEEIEEAPPDEEAQTHNEEER